MPLSSQFTRPLYLPPPETIETLAMAVRGFRGVRDDLSEIGRQLHDIACFFSPHRPLPHRDSPPQPPRPKQRPSEGGLPGVLSDLSEIGGGFRNCLSRFSDAFRGSTDRDGVSGHRLSDAKGFGVSEKVLSFVRDLVKYPESWLEFPLLIDCDFRLSLNQRMHVSTVEHFSPDLQSLRLSLSPTYMSEESFWMIYFALLHPTLNKHDSELLSTYQIVKSMRITKETHCPLTATRSETFDSQSVPSLTEKYSSIQEDHNETWQGALIARTRSQQSIDQWSDIASSVDACSDAPKLAHDHISLRNKDVDKVLVMEMYMDSLVAQEQLYSPYSSGRKHVSSSEENWTCREVSKVKTFSDEESCDWQAVEDSDFEILEKFSGEFVQLLVTDKSTIASSRVLSHVVSDPCKFH